MKLGIDQMRIYVRFVVEDQTDEYLKLIKPVTLISHWERLMEAGLGVAYGINDGLRPIGFLLGLWMVEFLTGEKKAFEVLWLVSPDKRKGGTALELLKEFEMDARKQNCEQLVLGCHAGYKSESLKRWYRSMGYRSISESFQKSLL